MHGQFIWYELSTPDVDAARKFYPRFTGWGTQPFDKDYTMWTTGGVPLAGLFRLSDEMRQRGVPPNWLPYVESSDVDETVRKATSLGARVMNGPADVPGVGRYAVLLDPQGAAFGVYKSSDSALGAWDGKAVVGRFSWHELMTTDYVAAFAFYRALFGWEKTGEMDMGGGNMYFMYGKGGTAYGGMFNRMPDMAGMPPFWLVYIHVPDVAKAVAIATKAGATVHRPQMDIPGGSIAILGDPQGAGFALHHVNAQPVAAAAPSKKKAAVKKAAVKKAKPAAKPAARKAATKKKTAAKKAPARKKAAAKKAPARKKAAARKAPKKKAVAKSKTRSKAKTRAKISTRRKARARRR
jgi:predicted enzyme related to lactoylglutathione lyase